MLLPWHNAPVIEAVLVSAGGAVRLKFSCWVQPFMSLTDTT